ncbi:MAG: hypothetical protein ACC645_28135 [Pirellulales bacterium]
MARGDLRIYYGPDESYGTTLIDRPAEKRAVTLSLGEVLPLLAEAAASRRTWLRDFAEDELTISTDLYEVLLAYQHYRRPSA